LNDVDRLGELTGAPGAAEHTITARKGDSIIVVALEAGPEF
jgi:hypothetical protein